jgi:hypothetical protein
MFKSFLKKWTRLCEGVNRYGYNLVHQRQMKNLEIQGQVGEELRRSQGDCCRGSSRNTLEPKPAETFEELCRKVLPIDSSTTVRVRFATVFTQAGDHLIPLECTEVWLARGEAVRRFGTHLSDERVPLVTGYCSRKMFAKSG